jgi:glutamate-1-semialdehyde 2,1-aminomutase
VILTDIKDIELMIAPRGNICQVVTLSSNPLALSLGIATLRVLADSSNLYSQLDQKAQNLNKRMHRKDTAQGTPHTINQLGSIISIHFYENAIAGFQPAIKGNTDIFKKIEDQ